METAVNFSLVNEDSLSIQVNGKWQMETEVPSTEEMMEQLTQHPSIKRIVFDAKALTTWDSSLLIFFFDTAKLAAKNKIQIEKDGLPAGVLQFIDLATAVPKKEDARKSVSREGFFARVGSDVTDFVKSAGELVTFIGAAFVAFVRMVTGRARFRASNMGLFLQEAV